MTNFAFPKDIFLFCNLDIAKQAINVISGKAFLLQSCFVGYMLIKIQLHPDNCHLNLLTAGFFAILLSCQTKIRNKQ